MKIKLGVRGNSDAVSAIIIKMDDLIRTSRGWTTAGAALSAMLSVALTIHPVSALTPAPAVPALER